MQDNLEMKLYKKSLASVFSRDDGVEVKAIRLKKADGTYMIRLHVEKDGVLSPPLDSAVDELKAKLPKLKNYSAPLNASDIFEISSKLSALIASPSCPVLPISNIFGFQRDDDKKMISWRNAAAYDIEGNSIVKDMYLGYSTSSYSLPTHSGNLYDNISFINDYLDAHKDNPLCASLILYGFSAVLSGYLNKNLLLSLSGKSSRGKTIISKLLISLYGETDNSKLSTTFNVTLNKMVEQLDGINGVIKVIDDLSLMPATVKQNIDNMVYVLESGKEKERMRTKSFNRDPATWSTTIILTSEEPILSFCDPEKEGAVGRLMEINISGDDIFNSAEEAENISNLSKVHYGLLADEFVRRLFNTHIIDKLNSLYDTEKPIVREGYQGVMARMAENIAVVTLCGKLLNQLFEPIGDGTDGDNTGFRFDTDAVQNFLIATAQDNLDNFRLQQKQNVILETIYPKLVEYAMQACKAENDAYVNRKSEVVISSAATKSILSEIQKAFGYKPIEVKRELKEGGVLIANDGPFSFSATIGGKSFRGICLRKQQTSEVSI